MKRRKKRDGAYLLAIATKKDPTWADWQTPRKITSIPGNTNTGEKYITFTTRHGVEKYRLCISRWNIDLEYDTFEDAALVRESILIRNGRLIIRPIDSRGKPATTLKFYGNGRRGEEAGAWF